MTFFDRRKHERIEVNGCTVRCADGKWSAAGRVINISEGGMSAELESAPHSKGEVGLFFRYNGREIKKKAVIAWYIENEYPERSAKVGFRYIE